MQQLPTYLDRYPAKMVSRLAEELIDRYAQDATKILDPFCGSGAILAAGLLRSVPVTGWDINPYAVLLSSVKLQGCHLKDTRALFNKFVGIAQNTPEGLPISLHNKDYWFTKATLAKYERLRFAADHLDLHASPEGRIVLLSLALSVRLCSRADQRSPKPFISKTAIRQRSGRHYDPYKVSEWLLNKLLGIYGTRNKLTARVSCIDASKKDSKKSVRTEFSHIITSPPYINAQDYFRNSKLELFVLEGILPFSVEEIKHRFIGTERGELIADISKERQDYNIHLLPILKCLKRERPRLAEVVHRYLYDMANSFDLMSRCLRKDGGLVLVCGDNLVGGHPIPTWKLLSRMLESRGFVLVDRYGDDINCRMLAPRRKGHTSLIKKEIVSAFKFGESCT